MTPLAIARTRAGRSADPIAFLGAYTTALQADPWGLDTEQLLRAAQKAGHAPQTAGLIEGLAALHAEARTPIHAKPIHHRLPTGGTT